MKQLTELLRRFFTHKDFLPPAEEWPGTLFTPLQIAVCVLLAGVIAYSCVKCSKKSEKTQKTVFIILWAVMVITEPLISVYDSVAGREVFADWTGILPLWPCSIFMYALPFAVFGKGKVRQAACGYICTLGLLGGTVNFVYPANYLSYYSCLSLAGFRTMFYHGSMVFTAVTMLLSGYHSMTGAREPADLLLPAAIPLVVSVPANITNLLIPGADYMFFRMESFFFAPIGRATPDWLSAILVYIIYLIIAAVPYLPWYKKNRGARQETAEVK